MNDTKNRRSDSKNNRFNTNVRSKSRNKFRDDKPYFNNKYNKNFKSRNNFQPNSRNNFQENKREGDNKVINQLNNEALMEKVKYNTKIDIQEKLMKKYIESYSFPRPEDEKYIKYLNEITGAKFITYEELNKDKPMEKRIIQKRETNKHPMLKHIRAIAELTNIQENVMRTSKDEDDDVVRTSRRIMDINGTRIMSSGYPMYLVKCNAESTDNDRIRHIDAKLQILKEKFKDTISDRQVKAMKRRFMIGGEEFNLDEFQRSIDRAKKEGNKEELDEWLQNIIEIYEGDLLKVIKQNTPTKEEEEYDSTFEDPNDEFEEIEEEEDEDNLINTSNKRNKSRKKDMKKNNKKVKKEINNKKEKKKEKKKKYLDKDTLINLTDIIYYLNEKELYESSKYFNDGTLMVGAAHVPKLLDLKRHFLQFGTNIEGYTQIIVRDKDVKENLYIDIDKAKFIMRTYGNDHTYTHDLKYLKYIYPNSSTIIPQPEDSDYNFILKTIPLDKYDCDATYYVRFKIVKITKPQIADYLSEKDVAYNTYDLIDKLQHSRSIKGRIAIVNEENKPDLKIYNDIYSIENKKRIESLFSKLKEPIKIEKEEEETIQQQLDQRCNVVDGKYYLSKMEKRKWYGLRTMTKIQIDPLTTMYEIQNVPQEVVDKARLKLIQLEKIDTKSLRGFLSYLNKELPNYNIFEHIIPLAARLIKDTMESEIKIKSIMSSKLIKMVNDIKDEKMKLVYQSESTICKVYRLLRNIFTFTNEKEYNLNITQLDF
jgi:hypothetical protein